MHMRLGLRVAVTTGTKLVARLAMKLLAVYARDEVLPARTRFFCLNRFPAPCKWTSGLSRIGLDNFSDKLKDANIEVCL